jgi:hypothetical protein
MPQLYMVHMRVINLWISSSGVISMFHFYYNHNLAKPCRVQIVRQG